MCKTYTKVVRKMWEITQKSLGKCETYGYVKYSNNKK